MSQVNQNFFKKHDEEGGSRRVLQNWNLKLVGFLAITLAAINIFGGFLVTQRMLAMYKKKKKIKK